MEVLNSRLRMHLLHTSKSKNFTITIHRAFHTRTLSNTIPTSQTIPFPNLPSQKHQKLSQQQRLQQRRRSSFLHDSSVSPSKRQTQIAPRVRGIGEGDARSKISTLALTRDSPNPFEAVEAEPSVERTSQETQKRQEQEADKQGSSQSQAMTPRSRRLLMLAGILLFPMVGGDLIEAVVPGLLGVIIYVAGSIKTSVQWVRSLGSKE